MVVALVTAALGLSGAFPAQAHQPVILDEQDATPRSGPWHPTSDARKLDPNTRRPCRACGRRRTCRRLAGRPRCTGRPIPGDAIVVRIGVTLAVSAEAKDYRQGRTVEGRRS